MADSIRDELGDFLRSRRERLTPADSGLPSRRRRTPGLRREEVAALAGIGVDWYVRLEQGRCVRPSKATLDALAEALRLDDGERLHLRDLAGATEEGPFVRETVPPRLVRFVERLREPAYLLGRRWDVLAWNRGANGLFGFERLEEDDRNILVQLLTNSANRRLFGTDWSAQARRVVAQFRGTYDTFARDPAFVALRRRLRAECPEFDGWWKGHDVKRVASGTKTLRHPTKGTLRFEHASLAFVEDPRLRLVVFARA